MRTPSARASGVADLEVVVDSRERYAYSFADRQVITRRARLAAGDYGVVRDDTLVASVERKSLPDLVSSLTSGKLGYQLAELAGIPRAAVVVEDRYSAIFKLERVRPAVVADGLAECQVRWSAVPILFCETRNLAQEWTYRSLAAAAAQDADESGAERVLRDLAQPPPLAPAPPRPAQVRAWALEHGYDVSDRGRIPAAVTAAYRDSRGRGAADGSGETGL